MSSEPIYAEIEERGDEFRDRPVSDSDLYEEIPNETDKLDLSREKQELRNSKLLNYTKYLEDTEDALIRIVEDDLFDLPEQEIIDEDCEELSKNLDIPEDDIGTVELTLRTIITVYSKSEKKHYRRGNGWLPLLGHLMLKGESKAKTYLVFKSIRDDFIPTPETHGYVLRLLILYHDPQLCALLDDDKISLAKSTEPWINALFAGICSNSVIEIIWNFIFGHDAFMIFFVFLAVIIKNRKELFEKKFAEPRKREKQIESLPRDLNKKTIRNIIESASSYNKNTPAFFKRFFAHFMFGEIRHKVPQNLPPFLPTSAIEVVENVIGKLPSLSFNYIVADCRPAPEYGAGHLAPPYNFNVDCDMIIHQSYLRAMVTEVIKRTRNEKSPERSITSNESLYASVSKSEQIKHICLMGRGPIESDDCIKTFSDALLKKGTKYISILAYGYEKVHEYARISGMMSMVLSKHNKEKCVICKPELQFKRETSPTESLASVRSRAKAKLAEKIKKKLQRTGVIMRGGLLSCVSDSSGTHCEETTYGTLPTSRQSDSYGAGSIGTTFDNETYGTTSRISESIMNVDDDDDENDGEMDYHVVSISEFMKDEAQVFECKQIIKLKNKEYNSRLILNDTHFLVLRLIKDLKDMAYLIKKCRILNVEKCTISPRNKHVATFHFDKINERGEKIPDGKITLNIPKIREVSILFRRIYNPQSSSQQ